MSTAVLHWYPMNMIFHMLEEHDELYKMNGSDHCCEPKMGPQTPQAGLDWTGWEAHCTGPESPQKLHVGL